MPPHTDISAEGESNSDGQRGLLGFPEPQGLYDPRYEKDACGVGFVCHTRGEPSHAIIERGIEVLQNLLHRGAAGADLRTGDGAGILTQIPDQFFRQACGELGLSLPEPGRYGLGMMFLPLDPDLNAVCRTVVERAVAGEGLRVIG